MNTTPKDQKEHRSCQLHNVHCCATCCHHEDECDYGSCHRAAVELVDCFDDSGRIVERRPACRKHANYKGPAFGVGHGRAA